MEALKTTGSVIGRTLKRYLLAGLATVLPLFVTIYLLYFVVRLADKVVGQYINQALNHAFGFTIPGLGVVIILAVMLVAGYFSRLYIGQKLLPMLDRLLGKIPIISDIYPPAKEFANLVFTDKGRKHFRRVVLVPYPSPRSYALGFALASLGIIGGARMATVLLVMGLPILDVAWQIIRRRRLDQPIGLGDRGHLHFRLYDLGYSQRIIVLSYYGFCALFGLLAFLLPSRLYKLVALLLMGLAVGPSLLWLSRRDKSGSGRQHSLSPIVDPPSDEACKQQLHHQDQ